MKQSEGRAPARPKFGTPEACPPKGLVFCLTENWCMGSCHKLRERWKQEVPAAQGRRCWLLTLDTNLSADKADEIKQLGLEAVYCLSDVASKLQREGKTWVRSLDNLPDDLRQVLEVQS